MSTISIRPIDVVDKTWIDRILTDRWSSTTVVTRGIPRAADELPGFVAIDEGVYLGLITYHIEAGACEIVTLDSLVEGCGIGSSLLEYAEQAAKEKKCNRIWLITTNDNLQALRFFQRREYVIAAVYRDELKKSRQLKPQIPLVGKDGIPIRDEIELEKIL
jgi:GNAT superfamily N-acetyltransferase